MSFMNTKPYAVVVDGEIVQPAKPADAKPVRASKKAEPAANKSEEDAS